MEHDFLKKIKDTNGTWKETDREVHKVITNYFTDFG